MHDRACTHHLGPESLNPLAQAGQGDAHARQLAAAGIHWSPERTQGCSHKLPGCIHEGNAALEAGLQQVSPVPNGVASLPERSTLQPEPVRSWKCQMPMCWASRPCISYVPCCLYILVGALAAHTMTLGPLCRPADLLWPQQPALM